MNVPSEDTGSTRRRARRETGTLAARLATALVLVLVLATGAAAGWGYARGRAGVLRDARAQLDGRARVAAGRLERAGAERERLTALWPGLSVPAPGAREKRSVDSPRVATVCAESPANRTSADVRRPVAPGAAGSPEISNRLTVPSGLSVAR